MEHKGRILIVDDEANARSALAELLKEEGYSVETAADGFKALPKLDDFSPDVLLTDLKMPALDGIEPMKRAHERDPDCAVIVMTAFGAIDTAVRAMRNGAVDYLTKPVNLEELGLILARELERSVLKKQAQSLRAQLAAQPKMADIVGASPAMQRVFDAVSQVAPSRASVLITGESGTGKEEPIAAAIHRNSPRADGPFVKLHCAALAEGVLESELFGHERGAFTGALARRDGRFWQADRGTLFLDEIGEISPALQVKLLRFLQEHEFERVGGNQTIKVDVRIVAATNRDLQERVKLGHFREDLYYRLNVFHLAMPPLRERRTDIGPLATYFLARFAKDNGKDVRGFSDDALAKLTRYPWPGNVRELENAIERAVVIARGDRISADDLGILVGEETEVSSDGAPQIPGASMEEIERYAILKTLEHTGGSTSRAAEILQISPRKIQYKLHDYDAVKRPSRKA